MLIVSTLLLETSKKIDIIQVFGLKLEQVKEVSSIFKETTA
jgi:hypothetical protein